MGDLNLFYSYLFNIIPKWLCIFYNLYAVIKIKNIMKMKLNDTQDMKNLSNKIIKDRLYYIPVILLACHIYPSIYRSI